MPTGTGTADAELLNLLGDSGPLAVSEIVSNLGVTRTAVRERLLRLMAEGLVDRQLFRSGRGRPSYRYILSHKARKLAGNNFADLAAVLWQQVLVIEDSDVRECLIGQVASALKVLYEDEIQGTTLKARMESLCELLAQRRVRCEVDDSPTLLTLTLHDCPYRELAEVDRTVCEMETILFSQLLGDDVLLSQCRLDGHCCCTFGPNRQEATRESRSIA